MNYYKQKLFPRPSQHQLVWIFMNEKHSILSIYFETDHQPAVMDSKTKTSNPALNGLRTAFSNTVTKGVNDYN